MVETMKEGRIREIPALSYIDNDVDSLQALNTALCFLCCINAHKLMVEEFLLQHPKALLFEGAGMMPHECAMGILQEQMQACRCQNPDCNQNRKELLEILYRGFCYYQERQLRQQQQLEKQRPVGLLLPDASLQELTQLEREVRVLRLHDFNLRQELVEASVSLYKCERQLASIHGLGPSLFCVFDGSKRRLHEEIDRVAVHRSAVERTLEEILCKIRQRRRLQFFLLKSAFDGCERYVCSPVATTLHK